MHHHHPTPSPTKRLTPPSRRISQKRLRQLEASGGRTEAAVAPKPLQFRLLDAVLFDEVRLWSRRVWACSHGVWRGGGRAVRREGNFGGKKGLTCKICHLGGQNGKTQRGPKVTSSSTRSSWRSPPRPRPSGRCPPRRAVIFDDFLDSHGIQLTPPYTPVGWCPPGPVADEGLGREC